MLNVKIMQKPDAQEKKDDTQEKKYVASTLPKKVFEPMPTQLDNLNSLGHNSIVPSSDSMGLGLVASVDSSGYADNQGADGEPAAMSRSVLRGELKRHTNHEKSRLVDPS
jgi:hypothetical protein